MKNNNHNKSTLKKQADGSKEWWLNGKRHREDGPAKEHKIR